MPISFYMGAGLEGHDSRSHSTRLVWITFFERLLPQQAITKRTKTTELFNQMLLPGVLNDTNNIRKAAGIFAKVWPGNLGRNQTNAI